MHQSILWGLIIRWQVLHVLKQYPVGVCRVVFNNQDVQFFAHRLAPLGGSLTMVNQKSSMAFTTRMN